MAKGKTNVHYFGGLMDNKVQKQVSSQFLFDILPVSHSSFYAVDSKGNQALIDDDSKRQLWDHYLVDVYKKFKATGVEGVSYRFIRTEVKRRCNALTKSGVRCKNDAYPSLICPTHSKHNDFDVFKHSFCFIEPK